MGQFIPAPAGNATGMASESIPLSVHPRACGERARCRNDTDCCRGSSPRLRGTPPIPLCQISVPRFIPAPAGNAAWVGRRRRGKAGRSWYADETYIKVHGKWCYLYRAIDRSGALVDVMFSEHRNMAAAKAFFESAKMVTGVTPDRLTTDGHDSYPGAIRTTLGAEAKHRNNQYLNNRLEQDHRGVKGRYGPMRGFKCPRSAGDFCCAYDELRNFLRSRCRTNQQVSAAYCKFHFLRRTATVLSVLEAA